MEIPRVLLTLRGSLDRLALQIPIFLVYPIKVPYVHAVPCSIPFHWWRLSGKIRIPDYVILVHSKISTISGVSSGINTNGLIKILSPLTGIKNSSSGGGGSHFQIPCVSYPHWFSDILVP